MAEWYVISRDMDETSHQIVGITMAMKVPGGMLVRTIMNGGPTAMVFVPGKESLGVDISSTWIEDNKIDKY